MIVTEYVPSEKMGQFHEILCATGGRYLRDPLPLWQREAWARCMTPIREVRRDQWWRVALRSCGLRA